MNNKQQIGRGVRMGTAPALFAALRSVGVWRAEVTTRGFGEVRVAIPATALRTFDRDTFKREFCPAVGDYTFTAMRDPLKTKKHTYTHTHNYWTATEAS